MKKKYKIIEKNFFYVTVENQPSEPRWLKKLRGNVSHYSKHALLVTFALYAFYACWQQHTESKDKQQDAVLQQEITE